MRLLAHAGVTLALLAAAIGIYYSFGQYLSDDAFARYVAVAALAAAFVFGERISRRKLLHPQPVSAPATEMRASLRKYWYFLIPPALFGPCLYLANQYHISLKLIGVAFFACLGGGLWPVYKRRAPFMFAAYALVIWFVSFVLGEVLPRFFK